MNLEPVNQTDLFGLHTYLDELIDLHHKKKLPNTRRPPPRWAVRRMQTRAVVHTPIKSK